MLEKHGFCGYIRLFCHSALFKPRAFPPKALHEKNPAKHTNWKKTKILGDEKTGLRVFALRPAPSARNALVCSDRHFATTQTGSCLKFGAWLQTKKALTP